MKKALVIIIVIAVLGIIAAMTINIKSENKPAITQTSSTSPTIDSSTGTVSSISETSNVASATSGSSASLKDGSYNGSTSTTRFGSIQIAIVVKDGKINDVSFLQMPADDSRSAMISQDVSPLLEQATIEKQSADIDTITGATYTSVGYIESLQSAIDQAKS